jgi:hypothetical protein
MNIICQFCGVKHWLTEHVAGGPTTAMFSHCCHGGKVILDCLPPPPLPIRSPLADQNQEGHHFQHHICQYNSCFTFTFFYASKHGDILNGHGPLMWKIGYKIYHSTGPPCPGPGEHPSYFGSTIVSDSL